MSLARRVLRPIYRTFFEAPLWRFLAKVKIFFFADTNNRLENIERLQRENAERLVREEIDSIQRSNLERIDRDRHPNQPPAPVVASLFVASDQTVNQARLAAIEERLQIAATNNAAQWDALEELILALFRQPDA